ncbi:Ig-like domain-containing protein [Intestinimonas massiliensis]|uniref:Ig-like domain-containing protein n=1 Tax=Intestinimonas massiliensis (ex Afouda et al. 2020) TaxID=1673721 RepID=A0AAW5JR13_9FIRM|nr:Ig-like domain-containing protein [Intestinimonas massiliensis (ex Afouda et al. 2020)]MCQ4769580.1 Ig-like domain-containing protein [Intestinimonas massiliensis (ex Afouda et al. 2020)]
MKPKKLSRFLSAVLALALVAGLMPAAFAAEGEEAPVVEIAEDNITLEVGRNVELTLTVSPNASVDWSSDDSDIATVSNGKVTAVGAGKATITAKAGDSVDTCSVTVEEPADPKVTGITLSPDTLDLTVGDTEILSPEVTADEGADTTVTWETSSRNVATVDNGKVTAVGPGTATITAKAGDQEATCEVKVSAQEMPAASITVAPTKLSLIVGESNTLAVATVPEGQAVSWTSSDDKIAAVSGGKVTAVAKGTATITASIEVEGQKKSAACEVTVSEATGTTALSKSSLTLSLKDSETLSVTNAPSGASVTWKSSKTTVASVDSNGKITAVAAGTATITASVNGTELKCEVTVKSPSLNKGSLSIGVKKTSTLSVNDLASGATVSWSSSKTTVATVSSSGTVTGKASGKATITATITYADKSTRSLTCSVTVTSGTDDITYSVKAGEAVNLSRSDFNDASKDATGYDLSYVKFSASSTSKGLLCYNYDSGDYDKKVSTSTSYYYAGSSSKSYLSKVSFLADSDASGETTFSYTGYDTKGNSFTGSIVITISKSSGDIKYTTGLNEPVSFSRSDFNSYCKDKTTSSSTLDYVKFTLPSSSKGTLYYKYDKSGEKEVTSSTKYYRSDSPALEDVTFVPAKNYTGTVSIDFTGKSTGDETFSGTLKIYVGTSASGDITYTAATGASVTFKSSDFNTFCKDETSSNLDYVKFTLPSSSKGTLYYKYDQSGEKKVISSTSYYRSSSPYLEDVTFVPAKSVTGSVSIDFSGKSTSGKSISGTVVIQFSTIKDASVVSYTTGYAPVKFRGSDFSAACSARGSAALTSVKFNLPDASTGRLYYSYASPTSYGGTVSSGTSYGVSSGSSIDNVTFVPKAGYKGTVHFTYTGTDKNGSTFTGHVQIIVTPPSASSHFTDMGKYGWAAPSVDFLYESKVTTGTTSTTYGPSGNITRGDFVLMLSRAFSFADYGSDNFSDVPANSYYAKAIASAKAMGIAQGSNGKFNPTAALTREDAMVLLQRTMSRTGRSIADASNSYLDRFSDGSSVSSYAKGAVAALIQAGIIQGDNTGRINPKGSLTRAEMAVILHRVLTL